MSEWAGILDGTTTTDLTSYIQTAANNGAFFPQGKWPINATTGILFSDGMEITGAGRSRTIFWGILGTGGTAANLAAYSSGSLFRRSFNVAPGTNDYLTNVRISDCAVILNHPSGSVTTTAIQIGIDLRNVTRSLIERVHVGNIVPIGSFVSKVDPASYAVQGYGIITGNVSSGASSYCGGEVHTIKDCSVWGAYKLISQDDSALSPSSSAHAVTIAYCDLQAGHHILVQESQYTTGCAWVFNTLQNAKKQPGDVSTSYVARCDGYNNEMFGGYIESGNVAEYILYMGSTSNNNRFRLSYYSATNAALITDLGTKNTIEYFEDSGSIPGGVDSFGAPVVLYEKSYRRAWVKFHWNGSAIVIDGSQGVQGVSRTGTGDYTITWAKVFPNDDYALSVVLDTNASGHGGTYSVGSHAANNTRLYTYGQNGGTTTAIDPRFVWVRAEQ